MVRITARKSFSARLKLPAFFKNLSAPLKLPAFFKNLSAPLKRSASFKNCPAPLKPSAPFGFFTRLPAFPPLTALHRISTPASKAAAKTSTAAIPRIRLTPPMRNAERTQTRQIQHPLPIRKSASRRKYTLSIFSFNTEWRKITSPKSSRPASQHPAAKKGSNI